MTETMDGRRMYERSGAMNAPFWPSWEACTTEVKARWEANARDYNAKLKQGGQR